MQQLDFTTRKFCRPILDGGIERKSHLLVDDATAIDYTVHKYTEAEKEKLIDM